MAIILPGVILSIMAFRGIMGNMLMTEKLQSQWLMKIGQSFFDDIEESVANDIKDFSKLELKQEAGFFDFSDSEARLSFLEDRKHISLVYWEPDSVVKIFQNSLLFVPERLWKGIPQSTPSIALLSWAQDEEFEEKNLHKALSLYVELIEKSSVLAIRVQALVGCGRIQRQLDQYRQAKRTYRDLYELTKDPEILPIIDSLPREIMADIITSWFQNSEYSSDIKDQSVDILEIISFIAIPQPYLSQNNYSLCFQKCQLLLGQHRSKNQVIGIDSLLQERNRAIHRNDVVIRLMDQITKTLLNGSNNDENLMKVGFPHFEDSISLLTAFYPGHHNGRFAMIFDIKELIKESVTMLPDHKNFGGKVHWQILDEQDEILIADPAYNEKKSGYSASSINLGVWNLNLQVEQGSWLREAFTSNQGIYFVGFIFVILGLIVGLIFTLRGLAQEGKLTRLKSNFISSVTHELKSPVTSIRQMSELLDRDRIQSEERKKEYYSTMLAQSERLSHLVENILDFSRLEYGPKKLRLEETEIDKLIEETIEIFKIRLRYTGFKIKVKFKQNLPQLRIDREGIQQVVYNLLDNAYKYSGSSREIEIEIMKSNTEVGISIIDCGIGIHPNDQKKIFNRYYRSTEEVNNDIKGNGIGLAIVSQIVDAHNGRLELKSQPGMGSTFTVFIPVTEEP